MLCKDNSVWILSTRGGISQVKTIFVSTFFSCKKHQKRKVLFRCCFDQMFHVPRPQKIAFTPEQTLKAITKSKNSKAIGPDGLSFIMMKHLGPNGITYLTSICNKSVNDSIIPSKWKIGKIIPLLKPGKPADEGASFRPVTILSPPIKILEALLLPDVTEAVQLANHQHGFRKGRSTTTAL